MRSLIDILRSNNIVESKLSDELLATNYLLDNLKEFIDTKTGKDDAIEDFYKDLSRYIKSKKLVRELIDFDKDTGYPKLLGKVFSSYLDGENKDITVILTHEDQGNENYTYVSPSILDVLFVILNGKLYTVVKNDDKYSLTGGVEVSLKDFDFEKFKQKYKMSGLWKAWTALSGKQKLLLKVLKK